MQEEIFFLGIVEDINDPKKLGRVKVRQINEYSDRVDSNDIPWSIPVTPVTSASYLGIGQSPTGIQLGSRVIGFFLDGKNKSKPVILGTYPIILKGNESDHSLSSYARGNGEVRKDYFTYEPRSAYAAQYPFNKTNTTVSGHIFEVDDTPRSERIHVYHKSGSYVEMFPDGRVVMKSNESNFDICRKDKNIIVDEGDINLISNQANTNIESYKSVNIKSASSDIALVAKTNAGIVAEEGAIISGKTSTEVVSEESIIIKSGDTIDIDSSGKLTLKSGSSLSIESGSDISIESSGSVNIECSSLNIRGRVNVTGLLRVNGRDVVLR